MHGSTMLKLAFAFALAAVVASGTAVAQGLDKLTESCETCHGKDGYSTTADVPIIAGFSREGFISTIEAFRKGERIAIEFQPRNLSWTGWSVRFWRCRARRNEEE